MSTKELYQNWQSKKEAYYHNPSTENYFSMADAEIAYFEARGFKMPTEPEWDTE